MKRILQIFSSIVIAMVTGCGRDSGSTGGPTTMLQKSKHEATNHSSSTMVPTSYSAEWNRVFELRQRQYEKMEGFAKEVSTVCAGTNGEEAVDALLAKVNDVLDAYECRGVTSEEATIVAPFVRDVRSYWSKRWFEQGDPPPANLLKDIESYYNLIPKTVDHLQKKFGSSFDATSLELDIYASLKWLSGTFENARWHEEKEFVDRIMEKWQETRYDVLEGNPLKDACEDVEFYASRNPNRGKWPAQVYSRTKNLHLIRALRVVGRLPKWFAAWAEEMERKDAAARSQSKNEDRAHGSSR